VGGGAGAAAQRRDLCAALLAECLKWSLKHITGAGASGVAVNVKSILRRLFAFQTHPEPSKRLGRVILQDKHSKDVRCRTANGVHANVCAITLEVSHAGTSDPKP
jgi:hypothetical protein